MKTKKKENKMQEITKTEKNEIVKLSPLAMEAYSNFKGSSLNMVIPKILVKNDKSPHLDQYEHLESGDIVETLNYSVLAKLGEKIQVIPFSSKTVWIVTNVTKHGEEFVGFEEFTGQRLAYEEQVDSATILKRTLGVQVLFLKVDEIADGVELPYSFTFKKSSANAGKKLNMIMYGKNFRANRAPWSSIIDFFSVEKTHTKGTFFTVDIAQHMERGATADEEKCAEYWYGKMVAGAITVDTDTGEILE